MYMYNTTVDYAIFFMEYVTEYTNFFYKTIYDTIDTIASVASL